MAGISFASTRDGPQRLLIDGSSYDFLLVSLVFCIYRKPFVRCEQLERQHVCLCALSHGGGQGCECILAKPGSHQQWTSGAGESPKLPLTVSASTKKTKHVACDLFLIYLNEQQSGLTCQFHLQFWQHERCCTLGWVTAAWWHWNRSSWHTGDLSVSERMVKGLLNKQSTNNKYPQMLVLISSSKMLCFHEFQREISTLYTIPF